MAAVTHAGTTWTTAAGDKTVTATPAVNDLIVVVAATSGLSGGTTAVTDNNSSGTYTQVDVDRTGFSTTGVLTVWVRDTLITSATSTIFTASQAGSTGGGLTVYRVSGMTKTGSAAVRGNGGQSTGTAATTPAPVLSQNPTGFNPVIGAVANGSSPAALTPRTGYTENASADVGYATPTTGLESMTLDLGETSATITWGGTSATAFASVAIELTTEGVSEPYQRDPRWYRANVFFRPSAEPFQSLGDATPPSGEASITLTDTGTASDSISISVDLSLSDTGAADDQLVAGSTDPNQASPQFATMFLEPSWASFQLLGDATTNAPTLITVTDAGTAADTVSITVAVPLADTGAGSDSLTITAAVPLSDTAAGDDALSVAAAVPLTDAATGADAVSVVADVPLTDAGTGADSISVNTGVDPYQDAPLPFPSFTAPFIEPTAKPFQLLGDASGIVQVSLTDSGVGVDTLDITATLPLSDTGAGADGVSVAAALPLTDAGAGSDALAITAAVSLSDIAAGDDALSVSVATIVDAFQAIPKRFGWVLLQPQWVKPFQLLGNSEALQPIIPAFYGTASAGVQAIASAVAGTSTTASASAGHQQIPIATGG